MALRKKLYAVLEVDQKIGVSTIFGKRDVSVCWAEGMVGVIAVFSSKKSAAKYARKDSTIITLKRNQE